MLCQQPVRYLTQYRKYNHIEPVCLSKSTKRAV